MITQILKSVYYRSSHLRDDIPLSVPQLQILKNSGSAGWGVQKSINQSIKACEVGLNCNKWLLEAQSWET